MLKTSLLCSALNNQCFIFFFQAEDGIRDADVTGVQTCALPIYPSPRACRRAVQAVADRGSLGDLPSSARRTTWRGQDSNLRRQSQCVYSASPLTAREPRRARSEERRVGKERSSRGSREPYRKHE